MRVLIACEFSGVVRDAFLALGHDAVSCDLLATERPGPHIIGDVGALLAQGWDLMIAHPPCTYLASSGARWWNGAGRRELQEQAVDFVRLLADCAIPRIAVENPIGILSRVWRKPDQIVQPWQHGHGETKATCLWLKGLAPLTPSAIVDGRAPVCHRQPQSKERWRKRSRTYTGIAAAMAAQWGLPRGDEGRMVGV